VKNRPECAVTKVAIKIYDMISNNGLVSIKKIDGDTYVTTTAKGDDVSTKLLQDLIACAGM
jgi:predicted transcriptional regulator